MERFSQAGCLFLFISNNVIYVLIWQDCKGCGLHEQCGKTMDCDTSCGYIASPGYPDPLASLDYTNCRWLIHASHNQVVEMEFLDFDVEYRAEGDGRPVADPRCLQSSVSLFTVASETQPFIRHIIGRFCNGNKPPDSAVVSTSPVMELQYSVRMISDRKSMRGFLARYRLKNSDLVVLDAANTTQGTVVIKC